MVKTESTDELLARKDREFAEWIQRAPDFVIAKYAREYIEVRLEREPGLPLTGMDRALCARLKALEERLLGDASRPTTTGGAPT